ncbi:hypothetical protein ABPG74_017473 [Tetrahymena malaccensis]
MDNLATEITTAGQHNVTFHVEGREDGKGYLTQPQGGSKHGLVLIQEWWGLNQSLCITADKFSAKGFTVIVPDVYRGKCAKNREEAGHYFKDLEWDGAVADMKGAALHLKEKLGCTKVGILGFCLGGALTFAALSATQNVFSAGAPFYGVPDMTKFPLKNIHVPIQAHFGELDTSKGFSDPETARKVEKEAHELKLNFELKLWKNGEHAFMNQNSVHYNAEVAHNALEEVAAFFQKYLA